MRTVDPHIKSPVWFSARYRLRRSQYKSVYIVDDDIDTCEALSVLFRLEGYEARMETKAEGLVQTVSRYRPDVILLNFFLKNAETLPILRRLKALRLGIPIIMLGNVPDVDLALHAVREGALSVHIKPMDAEKLIECVTDALVHDVHLHAPINGRAELEVSGFPVLTEREREVLQLIANGHSNKEAAKVLGISHRTVETHRARLMEKLCARNQIDLMRILFTDPNRVG